VTEFNEDGIKFKLIFLDPLEISLNINKPDVLGLRLRDKTFFSQKTFEALEGGLDIKIVLPKQFPSLEAK